MTLFELALAAALAARAAGGPPAVFHAVLRAGGRSWTFSLSDDSLAVTPPGAAAPAQTLEVHPSDTPPPQPLLETLDLDFDGVKDIRLLVAKPNVGQSVWQYWLFDKKARRFSPSPALDETLNARPDTRGAKGLLSAYWNGGARGRIYKRTTYRWRDGKLKIVGQEEQTAVDGDPDDFHRVVRRGGKIVEDKIVHDPR